MDEFKGTVVNVWTEDYWPSELDPVHEKVAKEEIKAEVEAAIKAALTEDEMYLLNNAISSQPYHYHGPAKFFGQVGKALAEALVELKKGRKDEA